MIQDIHPHQFSNEYLPGSNIQNNDYVFHFKENALLLKQVGDRFEFPEKQDLYDGHVQGVFLFSLNNHNCFLIEDCLAPVNPIYVYHEVNSVQTKSQKDIDWASMIAFQLNNWYAQNKYCGRCGAITEKHPQERAICCNACRSSIYPSISPAIIVAIFCKNKILLAKGVNWKNNMHSLVAGYVDVGEAIEDAVRREVKEEVGIEVSNIRYYKSQPWPYSGSMMMAFIADADDKQSITIDDKEIAEAAWFTRERLPNYPSNRSIAGEIIDKYIRGEAF